MSPPLFCLATHSSQHSYTPLGLGGTKVAWVWAGEREKGNAEELVCPLWRREIHCNMILMVCTGKVYMNMNKLNIDLYATYNVVVHST